jgi:predicted TIM-barrel fold metal-dependent hydrolase
MLEVMGQRIPVVDCHVHVFPDDIRVDRLSYLEHDGWFAELYAPENARIASTEELIASMDASGVDRAVLCGFPWRKHAICRLHNEYMRQSVAAFPDRLSWLGIASPLDGGAAEAEWCFAHGAIGIGELNADAQSFRWSDVASYRAVAEVCLVAGRPMLVHSSEPVGHLYPGKGTATPAELVSLAVAFPDLALIAAHWGGGLPFYELMPEMREALRRVAYDCGATSYLYDNRVFRVVLDLVGPEKVMFGSDYPVLGQTRLLRRLATYDWRSPDEAAAFLGLTAARALGIPVPQAVAAS